MTEMRHVYVINPITGVISGTVTAEPVRGTLTDLSGSIAAGNTAQPLAVANPSRNYFFVQNISSDTLWIDFGTTAVQDQPSVKLSPTAVFTMEGSFISTDDISIIGSTTGAKFVAKEG